MLSVKKITATTYSGETAYADELFIALDIYPKTNGTVKVTYGGVTKTVTDTSGAETPNSQKVYFGTFNGVTHDSTPASGTLTIEGDYQEDRAFGAGSYSSSSKGATSYCGCVTAISDWGSLKGVPPRAFYGSTSLNLTSLPSGLTSIGASAFSGCSSITSMTIPSGVTSIESSTFQNCSALTTIHMHNGITSIGGNAFYACSNLVLTSLPSGLTSIGTGAFRKCSKLNISQIPHGVTQIGDGAFAIGDYKFGGDPNTFNCAMYGCTIILPSTIAEIGNYAFCYDVADSSSAGSTFYSYVRTVRCLATNPPVLRYSDSSPSYHYPFGCGSQSENALRVVEVPKGCVEAYKAADGWSYYEKSSYSQIVEAS